MEIIACVDPASLAAADDVDRVLVDSRLLHTYMRSGMAGRAQQEFTYPKLHKVLRSFLGSLDEAMFIEKEDPDYDRRSIPSYMLVGLVEAGMFLAQHSQEHASAMAGLIKRLARELRGARAKVATLETEKAAARMILETQLPVVLEQVDEASDLIAALPYSKNRQRLEDKWVDVYANLKSVRTKLAVTNGITAPPLPDAIKAEAEAAEERRLNKTPINIPLQFGFSRGGKK